ncbi:5998_t:CDS:2, partial [Gigaspora margarita]
PIIRFAYYYKTHEQYENALKIAKEIPESYKDIKMLMAKCYSRTGDEKKVNRLKTTNKVRIDDYEILKQIAEYEDKDLSAIAKKKLNKYKNNRKNIKQMIRQFNQCDRC